MVVSTMYKNDVISQLANLKRVTSIEYGGDDPSSTPVFDGSTLYFDNDTDGTVNLFGWDGATISRILNHKASNRYGTLNSSGPKAFVRSDNVIVGKNAETYYVIEKETQPDNCPDLVNIKYIPIAHTIHGGGIHQYGLFGGYKDGFWVLRQSNSLYIGSYSTSTSNSNIVAGQPLTLVKISYKTFEVIKTVNITSPKNIQYDSEGPFTGYELKGNLFVMFDARPTSGGLLIDLTNGSVTDIASLTGATSDVSASADASGGTMFDHVYGGIFIDEGDTTEQLVYYKSSTGLESKADIVYPKNPGAISVAPPSIGSKQMTFSWGASAAHPFGLGFTYEVELYDGRNWRSASTASNSATMNIEFINYKNCRIRVRSKDTAGETSEWTYSAFFEILTKIQTVIPAVSSLQFSTPNRDLYTGLSYTIPTEVKKLELTWDRPSYTGDLLYKVYFYNGTKKVLLDIVATTNYTFTAYYNYDITVCKLSIVPIDKNTYAEGSQSVSPVFKIFGSEHGSRFTPLALFNPNGGFISAPTSNSIVVAGSSVGLSWNAATPDRTGKALTYEVQLYNAFPGTWYTLATDLTGTSVTVTIPAGIRSISAFFRVYATNSLGIKKTIFDSSHFMINTTSFPISTSPNVTGLSSVAATQFQYTYVNLTWNAYVDPHGGAAPVYYIDYFNGTTWSNYTSTSTNSYQFPLTNQTPSSGWKFRIRLRNGAGVINETGVETTSFTIAARTFQVPTLALGTNSIQEGSVIPYTLTFGSIVGYNTLSLNDATYNIQYRVNESPWHGHSINASNLGSIVLPNMGIDEVYTVKIRAYMGYNGLGVTSPELSLTVTPNRPKLSSFNSPTIYGAPSSVISWNEPTGGIGPYTYQLFMINAATYTNLGTISTTEYKVTYPASAESGRVRFLVIPRDAQGNYGKAIMSCFVDPYSNTAPAIPTLISNITGKKYSGLEKVFIDFNNVIDADGDNVTYIIDLYNGTKWINIVSGLSSSEFNITMPTLASTVTSASIRIRSFDGQEYSPYVQTGLFTILATATDKKLPNALYFDGIDDSITLNKPVIPPTGNFTVECNFKTNIVKAQIIIHFGGTDALKISINSLGNAVLVIPSLAVTIISPKVYADNLLHNLAVRRNAGFIDLVIDGEVIETVALNVSTPITLTNAVIGQTTTATEKYTGTLSLPRFWSSARTITDLVNNKNKDLTGNELGIIDFLQFDPTTGTLISQKGTVTGTMSGGIDWVYTFVPIDSFELPIPGNILKAENLLELRKSVNKFRIDNGLEGLEFTDLTIYPLVTPVKAVHWNEIESGISDAYTLMGQEVTPEVKEQFDNPMKTDNMEQQIRNLGKRAQIIVRGLKNK